MKKTMALVMAACMAGATLVGCGSSASSAAPAGDSSTSTAASSSDKQVTMDLIWWTDGNETKVMQGLIDEYEQLHSRSSNSATPAPCPWCCWSFWPF